jgi:hypothetical protein
LKNDVAKIKDDIKWADRKAAKKANVYKEKAEIKHNALMDYLYATGLQKSPHGKGTYIDIKAAEKALFSDGSGDAAERFIDFLVNAKSEKLSSRGKPLFLLKGSRTQIRKEANNYVDMLLKHHYVNSILEQAGERTVKTLDGKTGFTPNMVPNYQKVKLMEREMGDLLKKRLGERYANRFLRVAELLTFTSRGGMDVVGGYGKMTLLNSPAQLSIASGLARIFAVLREVVSPRWVGADAAIRDMRFRKGEVLRILLTSDHTLKANGVTVVEALYEILENANFNARYGIALGRLFPVIMAQSDLEIIGNEEAVSRGTKLIAIPLSQTIYGTQTALGYVPKYVPGADPYQDLVKGKPTTADKSAAQFRDRILKDFKSWTNFNHALNQGDLKALYLRKQFKSMEKDYRESGKDSNIIIQMRQLMQQ